MKKYILASMTVAVVFGCSVVSVKADDIFPPPWQRGSPNTTWEGWTYPTSQNPTAPDEGFYNPYGTPTATISNGTWSAYYMNHIGVWTLGPNGYIDSYIPNTPLTNNNKIVWTQVTWQGDSNGVPLVTVKANGQVFTTGTPIETLPENGWLQSVYETILPFNPPAEDVIVSGSLPTTTFDVGEILIDTNCPEPSSLALLAVGAAGLLLSSRKRRPAA